MENYESKQRLTSYISFVRDCELEKPINEINEEIVGACVKLLLKLQGKEVAFTTEQIKEKVRKIPVVISADFTGETTKKVKKYTTKKKILLIAAIIAILCAILAIFSIGYNIDYWHAVMNDKFGSVFNVPVGEVFKNKNEEFISNGTGAFYKDINDFCENEKLNVLLPSKLPDDISITRIQTTQSENKILVAFNNVITLYEIRLNTSIQQDIINEADETIIANTLTCYVNRFNNVNSTQIHFEHNGHYYSIGGKDEQILLDIIENLEEYE